LEICAKKLSDFVLENIEWEFLKNAVDFNDCDEQEISQIISLANCDEYLLNELSNDSFSIKDVIKTHKQNCTNVIDTWVKENWEDYLDEPEVYWIYDILDVNRVLGKRKLNGGEYESFGEFQMAVTINVINKIKEMWG
jgi:hypothetical protein